MRVLLAIVAALCFALTSVCAVGQTRTSDNNQSAPPTAPAPGIQAQPPVAPSPTNQASPAPATPTYGGVPLAPPPATVSHQRPCTAKDAKACDVSKEDLRKARQLFERGNDLKKRQPEQALEAYSDAAQLVPRNPEYATARELLKQQLVYAHIQRGNAFAATSQTIASATEFRKALELDPGNKFASERLRDVTSGPMSEKPSFIEPSPEEGTISFRPKPVRTSFHAFDDARSELNAVGGAFGVKVTIDPSFRSSRIRFDLDKVDFYRAMNVLCDLTRSFWRPVSANEVLVAADTPAMHKQLDRWVLRTFYLPEVMSPAELNDIVNVLRTLFEVRFVTQQPASSTITVRGPAPIIEAATQLLESMSTGRPQVILDIEAFEISRSMLESIGLTMPLQFNVFNIPASALTALSGTNTQDLINQLISSGGINAANNQAISALLAQLQSQQSSIFQNPVATFGGGKTLMGIGVPGATFNFSKTDSHIVSLEKVTMRAAQGNAATFRLGQRYPILNASYAPVFNTPQLASVIGGTGYIAPFPSFSYEDLGVTVKAKPLIHGTSDVTLDLEMEIRSLGATSFNGVPVINQRSYKGVITVKDSEPAVVAGSLSESEIKSLQGLPGISRVPGLNQLTSANSKQIDRDELLIVITPHIISAGPGGSSPVIRIPTGEQ